MSSVERERDDVPSSVSSSVMNGGRCRLCREWITVDELGLFDIGNNDWIGSNRINCGKWMVVWYGMTRHA